MTTKIQTDSRQEILLVLKKSCMLVGEDISAQTAEAMRDNTITIENLKSIKKNVKYLRALDTVYEYYSGKNELDSLRLVHQCLNSFEKWFGIKVDEFENIYPHANI